MGQRLEDYAAVGAVFAIPLGAAALSFFLKPPEVAARITKVRHESRTRQTYGPELVLMLLPKAVVAPEALPVRVLAVPIERGQTLRTSIDWQNIGTVRYAFDVLSLIGDWDPATRTFTVEYGWGVLDVAVDPGVALTTNIDGTIPSYAKGGLRDGLVLICDYDPATGTITKVYAAVVVEDAINVTGVGAGITAVRYARV